MINKYNSLIKREANEVFQRSFRLASKILALGLSLFVFGCEEQFIPEISSDPEEIVVEGYIEAGDFTLPPYVFLTRSQPFFAELDLGNFDNFFVHDANVTVSDGSETITLEEICWNDFDEEQQTLINELLRISGIGGIDSIPGNVCVYVDLDFEMVGEVGRTYDLKIDVEDKFLSASTSLVNPVEIDSLWFVIPEGNVPDTLKELRMKFRDPAGEINFYRYFTSINGSNFTAPFNSVVDDAFFDGLEFEFPLPKSETGDNEVETPTTFGLYTVGDTARIKWALIDEPHFNFWNTLEFNAINQGPFSSYTKVETNVTGGIGIWGGYTARYYEIIVD